MRGENAADVAQIVNAVARATAANDARVQLLETAAIPTRPIGWRQADVGAAAETFFAALRDRDVTSLLLHLWHPSGDGLDGRLLVGK